MKQKRRKLSVVQECYSRAAEARRLADTAATPAERADLLAIEQRWLALARNQKSIMRLVVVMCLVLALACSVILFTDEAADFRSLDKGMVGRTIMKLPRELLRVHVSPRPDAQTVMHQLSAWTNHYNEVHPHKALGYRSPREFIAAHGSS